MFRFRTFFKYWLPVILWMMVIFSASGDKLSAQRSSRLIGPVVRWIFPDMSETRVQEVIFWVRKGAHVTEYAILALLLWRACRKPLPRDPRPWQWSTAAVALAVSSFYAATDELHQHFVPNRQGSVWDVLLDTCGAALGLILLWRVGRWRKMW